MIASVGQLWSNRLNDKVLVITDIKDNIIHFHYLNDSDGKNGRNTKIFYSVYQPLVETEKKSTW